MDYYVTNDSADWNLFNLTTWNEFDSLFISIPPRVFIVVLYSLVFLLCFLGNVTVLVVVILKHRRLRLLNPIYLMNLAVADVLVSIFCIYPNLINFLFTVWKLGKVGCKLTYYVQAVCYSVSILTLMVISVERCVMTVHPLRRQNAYRKQFLAFVIYAIWLVSGVLNIPHLLIYDTVTYNIAGVELTHCIIAARMFNMQVYTTVNFVLWYCLPVLVLTFCYARIGIALLKLRANSNVEIQYETPLTQSTNRSSSSDANKRVPTRIIVYYDGIKRNDVTQKRNRAIRLLVAMVLSFIITMLPYQVRVMWQTWSLYGPDTFLLKMITISTFVCYYSHSALNPILYAFLSRSFRHAMRATMCSRCHKKKESVGQVIARYSTRLSHVTEGHHGHGHNDPVTLVTDQ